MDQIPFQTVQNSIDHICGLSDEADLEKASNYLFEVQPDLAGFYVEFIEDLSNEAQDLGFMIALILYAAFEKHYQDLRAMTEDEVVGRFESSESDLTRFLQLTDELVNEIRDSADSQTQPQVLNYLIEELFMSPDLEPQLDQSEQAQLFVIGKFFSDCLNELASEKMAEVVRH